MNNPLWFKAKKYGWGWYPATWQGWAVLGMYIFAVSKHAFYVDTYTNSVSSILLSFLPDVYIMTVFLIIICYATGEKPRWRWGDKTTSNTEQKHADR